MIRASEVMGGRSVPASQLDRSNQLDDDPVEEDHESCDFRECQHPHLSRNESTRQFSLTENKGWFQLVLGVPQ